MSNMNQQTNKTEESKMSDNAAKMHAQIKASYSKLSDDDIKLYNGKPDQFFAKLKEKQNVSKEDGMKKMQEIEKSCGCSMTKAA